jgi:hypothetical protein
MLHFAPRAGQRYLRLLDHFQLPIPYTYPGDEARQQGEHGSPDTGSAATGARLSNESYPDVLSPGPLWLALFRKCFWSLDKVL